MKAQYGRLAKRAFTALQKKQVRSFRQKQGLDPIITKTRACLKCEKEFDSYGAQNRMCNDCRELSKPADWGAHANFKAY